MRILLLSNGHGEDLSGALLAEALIRQGAEVLAMPLVGQGSPYRQRNIPLLGTTHEISTGGLGYTNFGGQLIEIWEGQLQHLFREFRELWKQRRQLDLIIAIGDVVPLLAAWLSRRPLAAYLVAYSSHYEGRLRLPWPCGWLLRSQRVRAIWARDALTATDLSAQLKRPVTFLGNPFFDLVADQSNHHQPSPPGQTLVLLPGSRMPEALRNFGLMLQLIDQLPQDLAADPHRLRLRAALVKAFEPKRLFAQLQAQGWVVEHDRNVAHRRGWCIELVWGAFAATLGAATVVLSMAGTATEQAVGLGLPVIQLAGGGPQFTAGFAEAQRRLLGHGLFCAAGPAGAAATLEHTAQLCAELLETLQQPERSRELHTALAHLAAERIGAAGGTVRMASAAARLAGAQPPTLESATSDG